MSSLPDLDGLRVQAPGEHQIWLVFSDQRHYIASLDVMRAIFRDDAFQADPDCARLPEGSVLGPGSRLVRGQGSETAYLVVSSEPGQETRHRVVDAAQFDRYGFDPEKVTEIPPEALRDIPVGLPLGPYVATAPAERENFERLLERLHPDRTTLLLLLEERDGFAERFAAHIRGAVRRQVFATHDQETVRRQVHVLFGWLEDGRLLLSSGLPDTPGAVTVRPADSALASLAQTLRIGRIDLLATRFRPALQKVVDALGCPFDLTPMIIPSASGSSDNEADETMRALARQAARIVACTDNMLAALRGRLPGLPITTGLNPEPRKLRLFRVHPARLDADEDLRIVIWNDASEPTNRLVAETIAAVRDGGLAARFFSLGGSPTASPAALRDLGPVDRFDLNKLVCILRPHLVWFTSPAPEALDSRVSAAIAQGLPILASAACGLGLRLADRPYTWILPADATAATVRDELAAIRGRWDSEYDHMRRTKVAPSFYPGAYLAWVRPDGPSQAEPAPSDATAPTLASFFASASILAAKKWRLFK